MIRPALSSMKQQQKCWVLPKPSDQIVEIPAISRWRMLLHLLIDENIPFKPRVIGIVKDFHFQSLRDKIEPLVLAYNKNPIHVIDYYSQGLLLLISREHWIN